MATDPLTAGRLAALSNAGYLIERAEVRAGLILYRARPSDRSLAGTPSLEAQAATDAEAVAQLHADYLIARDAR